MVGTSLCEGRRHLANAWFGNRLTTVVEANLFRPALLCGAGFLFARQRSEKFEGIGDKDYPMPSHQARFQFALAD
jgi:hypothetical protein